MHVAKHEVSTPMANTKKQRFVNASGTEAPGESEHLAHVISKHRRVDVSKVKTSKRGKTRKRERSERSSPSQIDWDKLELEKGQPSGRPRLTFAPSDKQHAKLIKVLMRKPSDDERRKLENDLGEKFAVIYTRYRRVVQPAYKSPLRDEMKYCIAAARLCILKRVRPFQVIQYWHEHLPNFTGMKFPPLPFLASAGNIDQVSVAGIQGQKGARVKKPDDPRIHAYSDVSALHPLLRRGLTKAGFDLQCFSDRHLLTVQATAAAMARGHTDMFISSKLRPMVVWAFENLEGLGEN
jgi:hypothetical protein